MTRIRAGSSGRSPLAGAGNGGAWSPDGTTLATPCDDSKIYLWDAATGMRKATLEGYTNHRNHCGFPPRRHTAGKQRLGIRLRLWDPVLGRPWLSLTGASGFPEFSQDGRIVLLHEDKLTTYQVDPALEYRTLAHATSVPDRIWASVDPA